MKRLMLMGALAVLILPPPVAGGSSSTVEKLMQDSTTTRSAPKKPSRKRPSADKAKLNDLGKDIDGRLDAQQQLREHLDKKSSEGYEDRMKQKRREKAKRLRGQGSKSHFQEPQQQREDLGKAPKD